jgi:hypothetical protein
MCYLILGLDQHFAGKTIVFTPCGIAHLQPLFGQRPYACQRPCQGRREAMYGRSSGLVGQGERSADRQAELADRSEQVGILPLVGDKRTGLSLLQIALGRAPHVLIAFCHPLLCLDGAASGVDGATELDQHSVAGAFNDPAAIPCNRRF